MPPVLPESATRAGEQPEIVSLSTYNRPAGRHTPLLICFAVTLFLSATLLFLVQPMVGKMILPMFGGTPAVWNTCMLFFQAALLGGYAYAHATTCWLGVRRQAGVHLALLLLPLLVLPIAMAYGSPPPASANPVFWLLGRLFVGVGLPFFVVSTTGPLIQKWFADTDHPSAKDPYFLYAASNAGSLLALLGYPLLMQPALALGHQSLVWSIGYGVLITLIALCALLLWRSPRRARPDPRQLASVSTVDVPEEGVRTGAITLRLRMWWVLGAFVPSSLMLGVTAHITSNLAPVPLLWVLPLAIYLLTFVLVFASKPPVPHTLMVRLLPLLLLPISLLIFLEMGRMGWLAILAHLITFFVCAMVCHRELARSRPATTHLTEFYLWMSVGGVLGGVFNAIIAPMVFDTVAEYPLAIVLACLFMTNTGKAKNPRRARRLDFILPLSLAVAAAGATMIALRAGWEKSSVTQVLIFAPAALLVFSFKDRPVRFALGVGVFLALFAYHVGLSHGHLLCGERNFFGVKRVVVSNDGRFRKLIHGSTIHGTQSTDPAQSRKPLAYYMPSGPISEVFSTFSGEKAKSRVGIIGLGAGAVAAYAEPGQHYTFYEIDPGVERIARDPRYFTFLEECRGKYDVVIGDGRLTLAQAPDEHFGLIVLDAFSSDAIPTHLVTREALQLYVDKLEQDGVLLFHISNKYLDLRPLIAALAEETGLICLCREDVKISREQRLAGKTPSQCAVMARREEDLGALAENPEWVRLVADPDTPVWTDQYSSLLSLFRWR